MERTYGYFVIIAAGGAMGFAQSPKTIMEDIAYICPTWMCWVPRMYERLLNGIENAFCSTQEGKKAWEWTLEVGKKVVVARTDEHGKINMIQDPLEILEGQLREDYLKAKELVFDKVRAIMGGRVRFCAVGGASLNPELHLTWSALDFPMLNGWGLTETMCNGAVGYASAVKIGWNAPPCPGVDIKIAEDGEALIKGEGIINSYYNDPEANIGAFTEDGYFCTGDIIEMDEDGFVRVIDRKKSIVVLDTGKNVAPARIEAKVLENMLIDQIVVIRDQRKYITALIVPNWDIIINMFRTQGLSFDESQLVFEEINGLTTCVQVGSDIYDNPVIIQMIEQIINNANSELSDYEQIKRFKILPRKLTQSRGELTPTQKIKTRVVIERFADEIEHLYS
ncbi:MAG: AMP-binding protein [Thermosyntropha sp.]|nr:AMP-binding protein [Thermosyntropha sp.]